MLQRTRYENAKDRLARLAQKRWLSTQDMAAREHAQEIVDEYERQARALAGLPPRAPRH